MAPPRVSLLSHIRPCVSRAPHIAQSSPSLLQASFKLPVARVPFRTFTTTQTHLDWLTPVRKPNKRKDHKGRPRVCTGGSIRGTTVLWGDYGLRMRDHDRRISAHQLRNGEEVIRRRLRGMKYRLFTRITAHTAVYTKGNESRMGTGKGSFDHWAARVPVSRVIFEVTGDCHEQIIRDALRLAANKMPGLYEFVKKGDAPVMGITKLDRGVTSEALMRPRKPLPSDVTATRLPGTPTNVIPTQTQPTMP